jgi:NAD(P)-dependent dehydrogenase (short-subunit alcohol dehydrogenase family)
VRGNRSPYNRPETVEETAEMINAAGGSAVALHVDHTMEAEVEALFHGVVHERGRVDVLVNSIAGEDPLMAHWCSFWKTDLKNAEAALRQSLLSHIITAKHAAPYMIRNHRGLIAEVTENDVLSAGGNPVTQTVRLALKGLALNMAAELRPHGVAAVAITPGFLRSETMLERFGVTEETWRDGGKKDKNFLESESPMFVGRAVVALAALIYIVANRSRSDELEPCWVDTSPLRFHIHTAPALVSPTPLPPSQPTSGLLCPDATAASPHPYRAGLGVAIVKSPAYEGRIAVGCIARGSHLTESAPCCSPATEGSTWRCCPALVRTPSSGLS